MNKRFEVLPEHLILLRNMYVGWNDCEYGAPEIDPKRPYGNSSVKMDLIELLGVKALTSKVFELNLFGKSYLLTGEDKHNLDLEGAEDLEAVLNTLHKETKTALQIALATGKFEVGVYECGEYSQDWKKVN